MLSLDKLPVVPRSLILHHLLSSPLSKTGLRYASSISTARSGEVKKSYSHTLLLPKTSMPLKVKRPAEHEASWRKKTADELYRRQARRRDRPSFVLHDGPPYANGNLHMGHALNRTLKDLINRYKLLRGYRIHYVPGWDCHGLPIEMKALESLGAKDANPDLSPIRIREAARDTAMKAIEVQMGEQRDLGVMADWETAGGIYRTLDHDYIMRQLRLFKQMVSRNLISYRLRPTYFSPSTRTALAESELKYKDGHRSRSVYVAFPVAEKDMSPSLAAAYHIAQEKVGSRSLFLAIWTTTAWSLAGNQGVAVHPDMLYALATNSSGQLLLVAVDRLPELAKILGDLKTTSTILGSQLSGTRYNHMFHPPSSQFPDPVILASRHVTATSGTGLVHSAPAHGYEDYQAFGEAGLMPAELRSPIDDHGCFTDAVLAWSDVPEVHKLVGKEVLGDGTSVMIDLLRQQNTLLAEETIEHRYPLDWKTGKPIIVRATPQWFADVENIKKPALKSLDRVAFVPPQSRNRLEAFIKSRSEWCISRQRSWGVPIPAIYGKSGEPITDEETLSFVIEVLDRKGVDHWWSGSTEDFVPPHLRGHDIRKGSDTLDVWFDSGSSWTLLANDKDALPGEPLADVYLEGSDQHRGWFQSSLLTKISVDKPEDARAPYSTVITHGFVNDEAGKKMSKSDGNGISPMDVIHGGDGMPSYGTDVLRYWAASVDFSRDVSIGPSSIGHAAEGLRKIRSTLRFLLANVEGQEIPGLAKVQLNLIDRHVLNEFSQVETAVAEAYDSFSFNKAIQTISTFSSSVLSSMYFDAIKDSLYSDNRTSRSRMAILAVLRHLLLGLTKMIAPIVPHLAEEVHAHLHPEDAGSSVFDLTWNPQETDYDHTIKEDVEAILAIRGKIISLAEDARGAKNLRTLSQADAYLSAGERLTNRLRPLSDSLARILGVSCVHLRNAPEDAAWIYRAEVSTAFGPVRLGLATAEQSECPRCWLHTSSAEDTLCGRCASVVGDA